MRLRSVTNAAFPWRIMLFAAVLALAPLCATAVELELDRVLVDLGRFEFGKPYGELLPTLPIDVHSESVQRASTDHYLLWVDFDEVRQTKFGPFDYFIYVRDKSMAGSAVTQFKVMGTPVGSFDDQITGVVFRVGNQGRLETGTISLPIFGSAVRDSLIGPSWKEPIEVFLASERLIALPLRNDLKAMPLEIRGIRDPLANDQSLWSVKEVKGVGVKAHLAPGADTGESLMLRLQPKVTRAVESALVQRGKGSRDDLITIWVDYATQGRTGRTLKIEVPVRFVPFPLLLFLVTMGGALLGLLAPLAGKERNQDRLRAAAATVVVALVIEALSMVLVANNSEFRLLGFQLDPFQLLPAALLGVFVGMTGYRSLDAFRDVLVAEFWKRTPPSPPSSTPSPTKTTSPSSGGKPGAANG